jgi:hypothetical protein
MFASAADSVFAGMMLTALVIIPVQLHSLVFHDKLLPLLILQEEVTG